MTTRIRAELSHATRSVASSASPATTTSGSRQPRTLEHARATAFMREHGIADWRELIRRSQDDVEWFWDAAVRFLGLEFFEPVRPRARHLARHRLGDLVHGRHGQPHAQLRRSPPGGAARGGVGERGRTGRASHLRRAGGRDEPPGQRPSRAGRRTRRRGRALPSDVHPGRRRLLRGVQDRRDRRPHLLGVRRARGRGPPGRRRCRRASHGRRGAETRKARLDEGDRRRRGGRGADRPPHRGVGAARGRGADGRRPRPPLGRARRPAEPRPRRPRARLRDADDGDLHVGDDGPAEGRRPRARRASW